MSKRFWSLYPVGAGLWEIKMQTIRVNQRVHRLIHDTSVYHIHDKGSIIVAKLEARCIELIKQKNCVYRGNLDELNRQYNNI